MIDIHTHILPGVDDGARDLSVSLEMLEQAVNDSITHLICTPHVLSKVNQEWATRCLDTFDQLQNEVGKRGWQIELFLGGEIYLQANLLDYSHHRFFTLDPGGKYILLELPVIEIPQFTEKMIFELKMKGYYVVLAHPERNATIVGHVSRVSTLVERGALMQINAGSLLGRFGSEVEEFSRTLLKNNLVHFVASDAHDPRSRKPVLSKGYAWVEENAGGETANRLFTLNPQALLRGEEITVPERIEPLEEPGFLRRILGKFF